jgi:hypothetical protein
VLVLAVVAYVVGTVVYDDDADVGVDGHR